MSARLLSILRLIAAVILTASLIAGTMLVSNAQSLRDGTVVITVTDTDGNPVDASEVEIEFDLQDQSADSSGDLLDGDDGATPVDDGDDATPVDDGDDGATPVDDDAVDDDVLDADDDDVTDDDAVDDDTTDAVDTVDDDTTDVDADAVDTQDATDGDIDTSDSEDILDADDADADDTTDDSTDGTPVPLGGDDESGNVTTLAFAAAQAEGNVLTYELGPGTYTATVTAVPDGCETPDEEFEVRVNSGDTSTYDLVLDCDGSGDGDVSDDGDSADNGDDGADDGGDGNGDDDGTGGVSELPSTGTSDPDSGIPSETWAFAVAVLAALTLAGLFGYSARRH